MRTGENMIQTVQILNVGQDPCHEISQFLYLHQQVFYNLIKYVYIDYKVKKNFQM